MKPIIRNTIAALAVVLGTGIATDAAAQSSIGFKGGYTAATLRGDNDGDINWRSGFAGGMFVNIAVFQAFTIQPEVLFRQRGGTSYNQTLQVNRNIRLSYMDVPILFKLRLPIDETFYPHVYIGPQFSYNIRGDFDADGGGIDVQDEVKVRKIDAGGVMGFGLDIASDRFFFTTDFRYGLGGINVDDSDEPLLLKNRDLSIMVGVGINIGGGKD